MNDFNDTISSISTAPGEGGIGIIRISGDKALDILCEIFSRKREIIKPNTFIYGHILDCDKVIDEVMVAYMKAPHSYTTEDVVEIQCHGGIVSLKKILELTITHGARLAEPGEFTKRAFLNGRLDLTQAEAVIDLIKAKSDKTFEVSLNQLEGKLSKTIKDIREELVNVLVNLTVNIDYPDEDIEEITYDKLNCDLNKILEKIDNLLKTKDTGRILRDGLKVSIVGKPNVGKSSLMNSLLKESRAIVTSIPGTTRDTIEEGMTIRGIPIILTDTAGIRETDDLIEKIGIEKSKEAVNSSDLLILILDQSQGITVEDIEILEHIKDRDFICLINKSDLEDKINMEDISKYLKDKKVIKISIKEDLGIEELENYIESLTYSGKVKAENEILLTNVRHISLLEKAKKSISDSLILVNNNEPLEIIEIDVNSAYNDLGEIIGESVAENIIDEVFKRFCLGK